MTRNTDPHFVGLDALKARHAEQIAAFESWATAGEWESFHANHYDWWVFPVDRHSSWGLAWTVYDEDVAQLKTDAAFLSRYVRGVELVAASWGWDVTASRPLATLAPGQAWHDWPVRLYKAAQSVQLFGVTDLFASLRTYALGLMSEGWDMSYAGRDLSWLFTGAEEPAR